MWQGNGLLLRSYSASRRFYFVALYIDCGLWLYEGPLGTSRALGAPLCGLITPAPVASFGRFLGLCLVTRGRQPRVDFVGEETSFRLGPCGAYFRCQNGPLGLGQLWRRWQQPGLLATSQLQRSVMAVAWALLNSQGESSLPALP
ncbi:Low-density lipoprotein receptor class A domain-containing protein 2 [Heterocephalus glaber]|uniref:Low-density lipoprotein receptor class A domain-containing protein 2 n=1 Tax=Heterocephalus glaber TaxID=10181 RepID=G5BI07_HETGA|nr:Low-density lipoprotein receptor class A domain-containing protein 2 [Heterocephalus glaber]